MVGARMPDQSTLITVGIMLGGLLVMLVLLSWFYARAIHDVAAGQALVVHKPNQTSVHFTRAVVLPIAHKAEVVDISVKTLEIDRRGSEALPCSDGIRADIKVRFFVRVNPTAEDVQKVVATLGAARASDEATLAELFTSKFSEGLKTVAANLDFEQLYLDRQRFKEVVVETIGMDLAGYVLDDVAVDHLEQTPIAQLDPDNIRDAKGIRKITEITSAEKIKTAEVRMATERHLATLTAEMEHAQIELERTVTDALASLGKDTGRTLTREQLQDKLLDRVREVVKAVMAED